MNLEVELLRVHSAANTQRLVAYVGAQPARVAHLVQLVCGLATRPAQLAADVLGWVGEAEPAALVPHLPALLATLVAPQPLHVAVPRGIWRALQFIPLPDDYTTVVFDLSLKALGGAAPAAIRCYALTVAVRLARPYPELLTEVREALSPLLPAAPLYLRHRARREGLA